MDALTNATNQTNFGTLDWVIVMVYLLRWNPKKNYDSMVGQG